MEYLFRFLRGEVHLCCRVNCATSPPRKFMYNSHSTSHSRFTLHDYSTLKSSGKPQSVITIRDLFKMDEYLFARMVDSCRVVEEQTSGIEMFSFSVCIALRLFNFPPKLTTKRIRNTTELQTFLSVMTMN